MDRAADLLIIGAGAAGMMAAIAAARLGRRVVVAERMSRVGKKILTTGNGRCNLTNINMDAGRFHGGRETFVRDALGRFDVKKTLSFFEELGVLTHVEDAGRVFPITNQATSILDVLRYEMDRFGVEIQTGANINQVESRKAGFVCRTPENVEFHAKKVMITTGGKSYPNLGSKGGGFKIAAALGHRIVAPWPVLVQVNLGVPFLKRLDGLQIRAKVSALRKNELKRSCLGDALFAKYGLSGDAVLDVSREISECFREGADAKPGPAEIELDMFPETKEGALIEMLMKRFAAAPEKPLDFALIGLLHKRLIGVVLKEAGCEDIHLPCGQLGRDGAVRIAGILKRWRMAATGTQSWMQAKVTAGGVDLREIDPRTFESKWIPGLYFAGEVLDVDGDSGGFNLQWAWTSGHLAGEAAAM